MKKIKTILVIDDSYTNMSLFEAILNSEKYHILPAFNATDALAILDTEKPDLIILDLLMPLIDGYKFLDIIKNDPIRKKIPIVIVSAVTDLSDIQKANSYGVVKFFRKPIIIRQFMDFLDSFFKK